MVVQNVGRLAAKGFALSRQHRLTRVAATLLAMAVLASEPAHAASGLDGITAVLQKVIDFVVGPFGKAICTLAIMGCAIGWLWGRMEAERALIVIVAMGVLISAPTIAGMFTGI